MRTNYLAPDGNLKTTLTNVTRRGAEKLRNSQDVRALKISLRPELRKLIETTDAQPGIEGTIPFTTFAKFLLPKLTLVSLKDEPNLTECQAEERAAAWLDSVEGKSSSTTSETPMPDGATPAAQTQTTKQFVARHTGNLMAPRSHRRKRCRRSSCRSATQDAAAQALQTFQLRAGTSASRRELARKCSRAHQELGFP